VRHTETLVSWCSRSAEPRGQAALLEVSGLTKSFGPLTVLREISLQVRPGEIVAVAGGNGAGKSTLIGTIAGVLDADAGEVKFAGRPMPARPGQVRRAGVETVWQEHGLCDDLDAVANIFLGRPGRWVVPESALREEAAALLRRVGARDLRLDVPLRVLSRGQRQLVAVARALLTPPRLLVMDEPTASLGVAETALVESILREAREVGAGVLLATHDLEQVFTLADRIVVLRDGAVVADVSPVEVQRSDLVALMSGVEADSIASRQIRRLQSLADQLSEAEPAASLPLIVSAMAGALEVDMLCVHLLETTGDQTTGDQTTGDQTTGDQARGDQATGDQATGDQTTGDRPVLRRLAATGLPPELLELNAALPVGAEGGPAGLAAAGGAVVVVDDLQTRSTWPAGTAAAAASGVRSAWAAPILGSDGVLGTVSGYAASPGNPASERLELATIYLRYAASAIERERLLTEVSRRNRVLESLRGLLESLAGPERLQGGLEISLLALVDGLGADTVAVMAADGDAVECRSVAGPSGPGVLPGLRTAAAAVLFSGRDHETETDAGAGLPARLVAPGLAAGSLRLPGQRGALVAWWSPGKTVTEDALELLDDASRSLALAMERESLETARREAAALRRSQSIQRNMLSSLSHELRTPLTAIHGYASTLCQPDLTWNPEATRRFLSSIAAESARMERLVGDLLDSTAIESGVLRLQRDWCDLALVASAAANCLSRGPAVRVRVAGDVEPVWADHDRLEQVFVNLLENAASHGASPRGTDVTVRAGGAPGWAEVEITDYGAGIPAGLAEKIFEPRVRGTTEVAGTGLGLPIARGIVEAHGGTLVVAPADPGASFVVALPADPPPDPRSATASAPSGASWNVVEEPEEERGG
jgi:signal transduction histidine kinase/ABC-type branched-subunit amino acid transport system ATPase component